MRKGYEINVLSKVDRYSYSVTVETFVPKLRFKLNQWKISWTRILQPEKERNKLCMTTFMKQISFLSLTKLINLQLYP